MRRSPFAPRSTPAECRSISSSTAPQRVPYLTVYAATKAFVLSFSEGLAEELRGSGVSVQALCPGLTATEFLEVAETHRGLLVTRMPTMTADEVVRASLGGLDRGRVRVTAGWPTGYWDWWCGGSSRAGSRGEWPGSSIAPVAGRSPDMIPRSPHGRGAGAFRLAGATVH